MSFSAPFRGGHHSWKNSETKDSAPSAAHADKPVYANCGAGAELGAHPHPASPGILPDHKFPGQP